jgi:hypothetical protein
MEAFKRKPSSDCIRNAERRIYREELLKKYRTRSPSASGLKIKIKMNANISTETQTAKRYVVTVSFYMHAEDDETVIREAMHFANKLNHQKDCKATVDDIRESKFGKMGSRIVFMPTII